MKKIISMIIFGMLFGCQNVSNNKIKETDIIVAYGDNYTLGEENFSYPLFLGKDINNSIKNYGVQSDTALNSLNRLKMMIKEENPDVVILSLGYYDMLSKNSEAEVKENLRKLIKELKSNNIRIILLSEPKPLIRNLIISNEIIEFKDSYIYKELAIEEDIIIMEGIISSVLNNSNYKENNNHLNRDGYKKMEKEILLKLKELMS